VVWEIGDKLTSNCGCCRTAFHAVPKSRLTLVGSAGTMVHLRLFSSMGLGVDTGGPKVSCEFFLIMASKSLFDLGHSFALCGDCWPLLLPLVLASLLLEIALCRVALGFDPRRLLVSGRAGGVTCGGSGDTKLLPVASGKNALYVRRSSIKEPEVIAPPPPKSSSYEVILTSAGPAPKDAQAFGVGSRKEVNMGFEAMVWYGIPPPLKVAEFGDDPLVTPGKALNMLSQDRSLPFVGPFAVALVVGGGEIPKPLRESLALNASKRWMSGVALLVGGVGFCVKTGSVGDCDD